LLGVQPALLRHAAVVTSPETGRGAPDRCRAAARHHAEC
jgi:hypothetical protein